MAAVSMMFNKKMSLSFVFIYYLVCNSVADAHFVTLKFLFIWNINVKKLL